MYSYQKFYWAFFHDSVFQHEDNTDPDVSLVTGYWLRKSIMKRGVSLPTEERRYLGLCRFAL